MKGDSTARGKRVLLGLLFVSVGLCLGGMTLFSLSQPVNVFAYWLGYGDAVPVEVTKGSSGSSFGRSSDLGEGRVVGDGRTVRLYGVDAGQTVIARPRLIDLGSRTYAYHSGIGAAEDLVWLFPTVMFGFPFVFLLIGLVAPRRSARITEWLDKRLNKPGGPNSAAR